MKKIAPILAVAFFATLFTMSCKKDYNCKCTSTMAGQTADSTWSLGKQKKKDAEAACDAVETAWSPLITAFGGTLSCDIEKK
jgi:hypothetical protein